MLTFLSIYLSLALSLSLYLSLWLSMVLSAIIEHTNKVIYLEDDDMAAVAEGKLSLHRMNRSAGEDPVRVIQTLQMELQQIMKGLQ